MKSLEHSHHSTPFRNNTPDHFFAKNKRPASEKTFFPDLQKKEEGPDVGHLSKSEGHFNIWYNQLFPLIVVFDQNRLIYSGPGIMLDRQRTSADDATATLTNRRFFDPGIKYYPNAFDIDPTKNAGGGAGGGGVAGAPFTNGYFRIQIPYIDAAGNPRYRNWITLGLARRIGDQYWAYGKFSDVCNWD